MSLLPATFTPGLPSAGATGDFIGRDAHGNTFLLHWHSHAGWEAMGWEGAGDSAWPIKHNLAGQQLGLIVGHLRISAQTATHGEHPDDLAVDRFAAAMKAKLAKKRADGRGGWDRKDECSNWLLSTLLHDHVDKGDPVDVGNLAMMIHQRGETIDASQAEAGQ